jgi:hypothetical protein
MIDRALYRDVAPLDQLDESQLQGLTTGARRRFTGEVIGSMLIFLSGYAAGVNELIHVQGGDTAPAAGYLGLAMVGGAIGAVSVDVTWNMHIDCRNQLRALPQPDTTLPQVGNGGA